MLRIFILILIFIKIPLYAEISIGKFIRTEGIIEKSNINCRDDACITKGSEIYPGERIKTSKTASARLLLKDGTAILIYGSSDIIINRVRLKERDKPSELFLEKGKITILQKNRFIDTSLIIKTPVSIIKSVNSEINIVSGTDETAVFVYTGESGVAGIIPSRDEAFILTDGDESFIKKDESPSTPVKVEKIMHASWLGRHFVSPDSRHVLKYKKESRPADWAFIKND